MSGTREFRGERFVPGGVGVKALIESRWVEGVYQQAVEVGRRV